MNPFLVIDILLISLLSLIILVNGTKLIYLRKDIKTHTSKKLPCRDNLSYFFIITFFISIINLVYMISSKKSVDIFDILFILMTLSSYFLYSRPIIINDDYIIVDYKKLNFSDIQKIRLNDSLNKKYIYVDLISKDSTENFIISYSLKDEFLCLINNKTQIV